MVPRPSPPVEAPSSSRISGAHREQGARLAREMADRLMSIAAQIETARDPRNELAAVQRARMGLRGLMFKPETYARLMVMEALHRATTYAGRARRPRTSPSSSGESSPLAAQIARALFDGVCLDVQIEDLDAWAALLAEWAVGRGAPGAADGRRRDRTTTKWDRLARLFRQHVPGCRVLAGRTLASEWGQWKRSEEHLKT